MKRLYDIIADKQKSIFYIISLYIVVTCLELLPGNLMSTLGKIISIGALISFLLIPGKTDDVE